MYHYKWVNPIQIKRIDTYRGFEFTVLIQWPIMREFQQM